MENMIVYWNAKGEPLVRVLIDSDAPGGIERVDEFLYPAMMDVFGKDEQGEPVVNNSSFEFADEWGLK